ncbi:MAG: cache domain-containing protein [Gammaproteobacteria bacterium]|nr:cache domain-containing protein [Gammaproteobacteria bacterium]
MAEKEARLKDYIEIALTSVRQHYEAETGNLQAHQEAARNTLRGLKFGKTGYIFVYDYSGTNKVLGPKPELEGKNLIEL